MKHIMPFLLFFMLLSCSTLRAQDYQVIMSDPQEQVTSDAFPAFDPDIAAANGYVVQQDGEGGYKVRSSAGMALSSAMDLLRRFLFNLLVCWIIVHFFYYRKSRHRDYYFTFILFSSAMFLLLFVMNNLSLQIGFTLGLFAIFGMIRYRTESVPIREMTYLFIIIALSIINGIGAEMPMVQIAAANLAILAVIAVLEFERVLPRTSAKLVIYDRIELIVPEKREELLADLAKRTGLDIVSIEIGRIDFLKDIAWIKVTYKLQDKELNSIDSLQREKDFRE